MFLEKTKNALKDKKIQKDITADKKRFSNDSDEENCGKKKRNRHQYVRNNIEIFLKKKKTKGVKMHGNGIDFFLKDSPKESAKLKP